MDLLKMLDEMNKRLNHTLFVNQSKLITRQFKKICNKHRTSHLYQLSIKNAVANVLIAESVIEMHNLSDCGDLNMENLLEWRDRQFDSIDMIKDIINDHVIKHMQKINR